MHNFKKDNNIKSLIFDDESISKSHHCSHYFTSSLLSMENFEALYTFFFSEKGVWFYKFSLVIKKMSSNYELIYVYI